MCCIGLYMLRFQLYTNIIRTLGRQNNMSKTCYISQKYNNSLLKKQRKSLLNDIYFIKIINKLFEIYHFKDLSKTLYNSTRQQVIKQTENK